MRHLTPSTIRARATRHTPGALPRRGGFTLIEVLVAIGIFALMLTIVFLPLNLGLRLFHSGRARAELQQASQATLAQMQGEISQALYVFPNSIVPGVTTIDSDASGDTCPFDYCRGKDGSGFYNREGRPYFRLNQDPLPSPATKGTCDATASTYPQTGDVEPGSNLARIDFLLPEKSATGVVLTPVTPAKFVVTYYSRRLDVSKSYDPIDNPIVLFRAQYPYRWVNNSNNVPEVNTSDKRYADQSADCSTLTAEDSTWLMQSKYDEPNLEPLCVDSDLISDASGTNKPDATVSTPVVGSHTLLTPRGMALLAPNTDNDDPVKQTDPPHNYTPTTSFVPEDANGDGKIDRVTVKLELAEYDGFNETKNNRSQKDRPSAQSIQSQLAIDLPNVR